MACYAYSMTVHKQISATTPSGEIITVDENIKPLLEKVWTFGCETFFSCQGDLWKLNDRIWEDKYTGYMVLRNNEKAQELYEFICSVFPRWNSAPIYHIVLPETVNDNNAPFVEGFAVQTDNGKGGGNGYSFDYGPRMYLQFPSWHIKEFAEALGSII